MAQEQWWGGQQGDGGGGWGAAAEQGGGGWDAAAEQGGGAGAAPAAGEGEPSIDVPASVMQMLEDVVITACEHYMLTGQKPPAEGFVKGFLAARAEGRRYMPPAQAMLGIQGPPAAAAGGAMAATPYGGGPASAKAAGAGLPDSVVIGPDGKWKCTCGFSNRADNMICGGSGRLGCKLPRDREVGELAGAPLGPGAKGAKGAGGKGMGGVGAMQAVGVAGAAVIAGKGYSGGAAGLAGAPVQLPTTPVGGAVRPGEGMGNPNAPIPVLPEGHGTPEHTRLVQAIKARQRSDPAFQEAWGEHVRLQARGSKDPSRHSVSFLQNALITIGTGGGEAAPSSV